MSYIGTTIKAVAAVPASFDQAGITGLTGLKELGKVLSVGGGIGDDHADNSATYLKDGRVNHQNGAADGGTKTFTVDGEDFDDEGLAIIASANGTNTAVTVVFEGPKHTRALVGVIANLKTPEINPDQRASITFDLRVNSAEIRYAAA